MTGRRVGRRSRLGRQASSAFVYGCRGRLEDFPHGRMLLHLPVAHHDDLVGDLADQRQVVRDEQQRHGVTFLQACQQLEDLLLDRDVECRGRLVCDQQLRLAGDRHRDHDPLLLATGQMVRVGRDAQVRVRDADLVQQLDRPGAGRTPPETEVQAQRFADLVADGQHGIQRGHRLLENHRDVLAAYAAQLDGLAVQQVDVVVQDPARGIHDGICRQQAEDGHGRHRLAAAGLADQRQRRAPADGEADVPHGRLHHAALGFEADAEIAHFDQCSRLVDAVDGIHVLT